MFNDYSKAMDLPYDVLVYIFKYLSRSDRKAASETCRLWYMAANDYSFLKNKIVVFYKATLIDEISPLNVFENSPSTYYNYVFTDVEIPLKIKDFWSKIGDNVKCLTIKQSDVCEKVFVNMLHNSKNLETLNVLYCKDLFMSGRLLEGKSDGLSSISLEHLKSLNLSGNQYLTDALVNRFFMSAPALQYLNLSACSLQFHLGLVKKFYPSTIDVFQNPSESVLTFYFVLQSITHRAKNIKHLLFSNTLIDGAALKALAEVENLKLELLEVSSCDQLTNSGILALTTRQTTLRCLDVGLCTRITDQSLVYICQNLFNLEELCIQRCRAVTNLGIAELHKLKKLKTLNISECELITKDGLEKGLCQDVNNIIEYLDIHSLNIDESALIMISDKLPNLRFLDISYCFNAVTDATIQVIFKNQILLHSLKLSHCDKVSDAGLTGMGKVESETDEIRPVISNHDETDAYPRIHLGSRAEEEIVRDARRKHDVMQMCENLTMDSFSGYSLARMKGLKELDISSCNRITDVSLTYAFNFKDLIYLDLSKCQQITHEGIGNLVKNCPSIEHMLLNNCYNLKDDAVTKIVEGLHRLTNLELRGCNQLTDKTLEAIRTHCKKLKLLDVQGCRNMSPELACTIGGLPTLHTVLMTKPGPYIVDGVKNRAPSQAFLPALMRKLRLH